MLAGALAAPALLAQAVRDEVKPPVGSPAVASVGDTVYEKTHLVALPAFTVDDSFSGKNLFTHATINRGDKFVQIPSKANLKACRSPTIEAFLQKIYDACLYDDDQDGKFDRFGRNEVQGGKKIPLPLPYRSSEFIQPMSGSVKQVIIFLGQRRIRCDYPIASLSTIWLGPLSLKSTPFLSRKLSAASCLQRCKPERCKHRRRGTSLYRRINPHWISPDFLKSGESRV